MIALKHVRIKANLYMRLVRLDKPIGILLLLWPTLWGLWLAAEGLPPAKTFIIFLLGTVLMRSAGCAINDYADRHFDRSVARTRNRVLASGLIHSREALLLAAGLAIIALLLVWQLHNTLCLYLACIAALLAASYPYFKRFFAIPQAYLGIAFGFGIPMAFAAIQGTIPWIAWVLLLANIFWAIAYDTEYAMVDRADDLKIGIRSSAITFGRFDIAMIALCYLITLSIFAVLALNQYTNGALLRFFCLWVVAVIIAGYHLYLIRHREPAACFKAFLHNSWFGAAIFGAIVLAYI